MPEPVEGLVPDFYRLSRRMRGVSQQDEKVGRLTLISIRETSLDGGKVGSINEWPHLFCDLA